MLEINDLKKTFENGSPALKGVNLKINKGEFVSILGPSGSGKTTLLRTINGLETSTGGEIYFDNKKINNNNISEVQKKTGMIFQEFNLVNNLSAINNVLTGLLNSSNKFLSLFYLFSKILLIFIFILAFSFFVFIFIFNFLFSFSFFIFQFHFIFM